ncbi:hypothetical protein JYU34_016509 [Plutella xylostella]|uniref:Uncharacterized protein n=1 Tax=Plutella xylostella TaxID=51655 RepID=A0ABQ7Q2U0_PLUXY|nr:hypothetical protein JYU34_016509 [Plutella xylostella]
MRHRPINMRDSVGAGGVSGGYKYRPRRPPSAGVTPSPPGTTTTSISTDAFSPTHESKTNKKNTRQRASRVFVASSGLSVSRKQPPGRLVKTSRLRLGSAAPVPWATVSSARAHKPGRCHYFCPDTG